MVVAVVGRAVVSGCVIAFVVSSVVASVVGSVVTCETNIDDAVVALVSTDESAEFQKTAIKATKRTAPTMLPSATAFWHKK